MGIGYLIGAAQSYARTASKALGAAKHDSGQWVLAKAQFCKRNVVWLLTSKSRVDPSMILNKGNNDGIPALNQDGEKLWMSDWVSWVNNPERSGYLGRIDFGDVEIDNNAAQNALSVLQAREAKGPAYLKSLSACKAILDLFESNWKYIVQDIFRTSGSAAMVGDLHEAVLGRGAFVPGKATGLELGLLFKRLIWGVDLAGGTHQPAGMADADFEKMREIKANMECNPGLLDCLQSDAEVPRSKDLQGLPKFEELPEHVQVAIKMASFVVSNCNVTKVDSTGKSIGRLFSNVFRSPTPLGMAEEGWRNTSATIFSILLDDYRTKNGKPYRVVGDQLDGEDKVVVKPDADGAAVGDEVEEVGRGRPQGRRYSLEEIFK